MFCSVPVWRRWHFAAKHCSENHALNLTPLSLNCTTLRNCLFSRCCCIICSETSSVPLCVKNTVSNIVSQLCAALQQTPQTNSISQKLRSEKKKNKEKKSGTRNIKDPISLFKDTQHLLLCSHKRAASQRQMESGVLTEAACGARNTSVKRRGAS